MEACAQGGTAAPGKYAPSLLIGAYDGSEDLPQLIRNGICNPLDTDLPTCRYRGTHIRVDTGNAGRMTITAWQRNFARLRKMDVSLPTIITLVAENDPAKNRWTVVSADLHESFKGSKGIMCSRTYLDRNMKELLIGRPFDSTLVNYSRLDGFHCYHIVEVLKAACSYFLSLSLPRFSVSPGDFFYEEEVIDCMVDDTSRLNICGYQIIKAKTPLFYRLAFHELLDKISFGKDGSLNFNHDLCCDFHFQNEAPLTETISASAGNGLYSGMQKTLLRCITRIQDYLGTKAAGRMYHTNLYPPAFIGLLAQSLAMRYFNSNYHYIMHVLTSLQRDNERPLCIGSVKNMEELKRYFPNLDQKDLR
jgi:hypothetical protein